MVNLGKGKERRILVKDRGIWYTGIPPPVRIKLIIHNKESKL